MALLRSLIVGGVADHQTGRSYAELDREEDAILQTGRPTEFYDAAIRPKTAVGGGVSALTLARCLEERGCAYAEVGGGE